MKIIIWNANMAFRRKADVILKHEPDILVVPECECNERLTFKNEFPDHSDFFWYGDNPSKGLGIFAYNDFKIELLENHNLTFRFVVPLLISSKNERFVLIAVWAQKPHVSDNYGIHLYEAIKFYEDVFENENVIVAGDFNSSSIWDKPNREANHSNIVRALNGFGLASAYHFFYKSIQGNENHATLYFRKNKEKEYHIDYCFLSAKLLEKLDRVEVGGFEEWIKFSDHVPLIVTLRD